MGPLSAARWIAEKRSSCGRSPGRLWTDIIMMAEILVYGEMGKLIDRIDIAGPYEDVEIQGEWLVYFNAASGKKTYVRMVYSDRVTQIDIQFH